MAFFNLRDDDDEALEDKDGSMFGPKPGTWWVQCPSDPRWDGSGHTRVGGFVQPKEATAHLANKEQELGMAPPADCEWGYMKD